MLKKSLLLCIMLVLVLVSLSSASQTAPLSGNPSSKIYHNSSCRYYTCKACTVQFSTSEAAKRQGYRACKVCKG